jgi:hypothetical protein
MTRAAGQWRYLPGTAAAGSKASRRTVAAKPAGEQNHFVRRLGAAVDRCGADREALTACRLQPLVDPASPVIPAGEACWRRVFDQEFLIGEGTIDPADRALFRFAETAAGSRLICVNAARPRLGKKPADRIRKEIRCARWTS